MADQRATVADGRKPRHTELTAPHRSLPNSTTARRSHHG
jgi:hypothetical protein